MRKREHSSKTDSCSGHPETAVSKDRTPVYMMAPTSLFLCLFKLFGVGFLPFAAVRVLVSVSETRNI